MDTDPRSTSRQFVRDDFCSSREHERLCCMPPIRREDVRTVDIDEIARKLVS